MSDKLLPEADLTYQDTEDKPADIPSVISEQKAQQDKKEKRSTLDSRIRTLTDVFDTKDGKKLQLRDIVNEYVKMGEFPFLEVLCSKLGYDYGKVQETIAKRDGNPNREPFFNILLDVERNQNKQRGIFLRELAYQVAASEKEEHADMHHIKDRLAAIKLWDSLVTSADAVSDEAEEGSGIQIPDGLYGMGGQEE